MLNMTVLTSPPPPTHTYTHTYTHSDAVYHRSNFTLGGAPGPVADTALRVIEEALKQYVRPHEKTKQNKHQPCQPWQPTTTTRCG